MKQVKQFLSILVALALVLLIYEVLLTPNTPTIAVQHVRDLYMHVGTSKKTEPPYQHAGINDGKRTLRQLLQDREITQLPVKIVTDCQSSSHWKLENSQDSQEVKIDQDVVCLNLSKLYADSYVQYGLEFDKLSPLQQKASIVRAVLFDLEQKDHQMQAHEKHKVVINQVQQDSKVSSRQNGHPSKGAFELDSRADDVPNSYHLVEKSKALHLSLKELNNEIRSNQRNNSNVFYFPRAHPPSKQQANGGYSSRQKASPKPKSAKKTFGSKKVPVKMNPELVQLKGTKVKQSYDLAQRGFSGEWGVKSPIVHDRLKFIAMAINSTDPSGKKATESSLNANLLERAEFQHKQIDLFCDRHTHPPPTLPLENTELDTLFQHLLYDDSRKIVFCYVPKNGCSNMKRMMLVLNGILPPEASSKRRPEETLLKQVHSFRNLSSAEVTYRLQNYLKVAIVRNPLERLLSAYKNKIETPFNIELRKLFPERLKAFILKLFRREKFEEWIARNNSLEDIHPSFEEFVKFMNSYPLTAYNEHFKPFLELCSPCAVNFDLFLSFKTLEYDMYALMEYLDIPFNLYPRAIAHHSKPMSEQMQDYYSQISDSSKSTLFRRLSREFEFYYSIHPEEWGMNNYL